MTFIYQRVIRFQDTDAAGVVYFAQILAMCHEAYEESLAISGINPKEFFSRSDTALPIVHTDGDFFRPMFCGDRVTIHLVPNLLTCDRFEINYQIFGTEDQTIARANTKHVCINPTSRTKIPLPNSMIQWLNLWGHDEISSSAVES